MVVHSITVSSVNEALRTIETIGELYQRVQQVPGLAEGELEKVVEGSKKFINEFSEASRRQYRSLLNKLDKLAMKVSELFEEGLLSKRHTKILGVALAKMRMRDFYSARKLLRKFDDFISMKEEVDAYIEAYRKFYNQVGKDITQMKTRLERLNNVPKPSMSHSEVRAIDAKIAECKKLIKRLVADYITAYPSGEMLGVVLAGSRSPHIQIPEPDNPDSVESLIQLLGSDDDVRKKFGEKNLYALVEASGYTDARFSHILKNYEVVVEGPLHFRGLQPQLLA
jgi:hypothetical protein